MADGYTSIVEQKPTSWDLPKPIVEIDSKDTPDEPAVSVAPDVPTDYDLDRVDTAPAEKKQDFKLSTRSDGKISFYDPKEKQFYWVEKEKARDALTAGLYPEPLNIQIQRLNRFPEAHVRLSDNKRKYYDPKTNETFWVEPEKEFSVRQYGFLPVSEKQQIEFEDEQYFQQIKSQWGAFKRSAISGLTFGISTFFEEPWLAKRYEKEYPITSIAGEIAGMVMPISPVAKAGQYGLKLGTKAAEKIGAKFVTREFTKKVVEGATKRIVQGGVEGAAIGAQQAIADIGMEKPGATDVGNIGKKVLGTAALGGAFSVGLGAVGAGGKYVASKTVGKLGFNAMSKAFPKQMEKIISMQDELNAANKDLEFFTKSMAALKKTAPDVATTIEKDLEKLGRLRASLSQAETDAVKATNKIIHGQIDVLKEKIKWEGWTNLGYHPGARTYHIADVARHKAILEDGLSEAYSSMYGKVSKGLSTGVGAAAGIYELYKGDYENALYGSLGFGFGSFFVAKYLGSAVGRRVVKKQIEKQVEKTGGPMTQSIVEAFGQPKALQLANRIGDEAAAKSLGKQFKMGLSSSVDKLKNSLKDFAKFAPINTLSKELFEQEKEDLDKFDLSLIKDSATYAFLNDGASDRLALTYGEFEKNKILFLKAKSQEGRFAYSKAKAAVDLRGVLVRIQNNTYTKEDLQALKVLYPKMYQSFRAVATEIIKDSKASAAQRKFAKELLSGTDTGLAKIIRQGYQPPSQKKKDVKLRNSYSETQRIQKGFGEK